MSIVIDMNTLPAVFEKSSSEYPQFSCVNEWLKKKENAKIVYGGSTYKTELKKASKYLRVFSEYAKMRKVVLIDDVKVDAEECWVKSQVESKDFDDPHIIAIIRASKCKLICSRDIRAHPFFKNSSLYNTGCVPKIYAGPGAVSILDDNQNIQVRLQNVIS